MTTRQQGWQLPTAYAAIAALSAAFALKKVFDSDCFWMLAAGREVLNNGLPRVNTLSHTYPDYPWQFTQWLFAVVLALTERAAGLVGVQVLMLLSAAVLFVMVTHTARQNREDFRWWAFVPFLVAAMAGSQYRITPRGDLCTLLGLAAVPLIWSLRPRRMYLYAAALAALWSNLHAGVVFGLVEWIFFAAAALLQRDRNGLRDAGLALGAFFLGSLLNPQGYYPYAYIAANPTFMEFPMPVAEITAPTPVKEFPIFWGVAVLSLPALVRAGCRRDYSHLLLFLFFGAMGSQAMRFIPYFLLVSLPGTASHTASLARLLPEERAARAVGWAACALGLGVLGWGVSAETIASLRMNLPGWGLVPDRFPEGACAYIERRSLPGKLFNEYGDGGYVAWRLYPGRRVFIDGRGFAYPWSFFKEALAYRAEDTRRLVEKYGVDVAIVTRRPKGGDIDLGMTFDELGWGLAYIEGTSYVFVRPGSAAEQSARADLFELMKPWKGPDQLFRAAKADPGRAIAELNRIPVDRLIKADDHHILGVAAYQAGSPALAERFLAAGLVRHPGHLSMLLDRAAVLKGMGRAIEAKADLERILELAPASKEGGEARDALRWLAQGR